MKTLTIIPAYGRDYKSKEAAEKDFLDGKDFTVADISCPWDGKYCSIRDLKTDYDQVKIRYDKLTNFTFVELDTETEADKKRIVAEQGC